MTYTTSKVKLRGCNCRICRKTRSNQPKIAKFVNRSVRYANKKLCRNPDAAFNPKVSNYYD
jgi:hypothetical protein